MSTSKPATSPDDEKKASSSSESPKAAVPIDQFESYVKEVHTISEQKDAIGVAYAVIEHTSLTLKCDRSSFYFVDGDFLDLVIAKGVDSIRMPKTRGFAGRCVTFGKIVNIPDAYKDKIFDPKFDKINNYHTKQVLCAPVKSENDEIIGVLQCINKLDDKPFNKIDEKLLLSLSNQVGISIRHCLQLEQAKIATKQKNALLNYIKSMKSNFNVRSLLYTLNEAASELLEADRCTFYTVNHEQSSLHIINADAGIDIVLKLNQGIAGSVAISGKKVNIKDCYKDKRFDPAFDKKTGYYTKCMLVMPIFKAVTKSDKNEKPIAVVQLINKKNDENGYYTKDDEDLLSVLIRFIGPLIKDAKLFKRKEKKIEFPKPLKPDKFIRHPSKEIIQTEAILEEDE